MAQLTITVPNDKVNIILDALWSERPVIEGEANPPTRLEWATIWLRKKIVESVRNYKYNIRVKDLNTALDEDVFGI